MCSSSRVTHHALSCSSIRTPRSQSCYYSIQLNLEALSFPLEELGELTTNATRSPSQKALCLLIVRSRRSQIPDQQARYVVHKPLCFLVCEDVRATQDGGMCQRFHYCHDDEGGEIEIGDIDLIAMRLQIASNQCITLSDISLDIFEPPNTRDLFRKDAMQLGIDAVTVDCN